MAENGVSIEISRITTEMDVAMDSFYVYGPDGRKIDAPAAVKKLQRVLQKAAVKKPE
jgi:UTP:GlnB (protein PII) uridylyltransferase